MLQEAPAHFIQIRGHKPNDYVRQMVTTLAGRQEPLLGVVKRRNLAWYGHVSHFNSLAKTILSSKVQFRVSTQG